MTPHRDVVLAAADQLRMAVEGLNRDAAVLAETGELPDVLDLLGLLQTLAGGLADVVGYVELTALIRGADDGVTPSGAVVTRKRGGWKRTWVPHREVVKAIAPELLGELGPRVYDLLDRLEGALPKSVPWKLDGIRPYADPDELCKAERYRTTLKVTPATSEEQR
jgi:hypothetical protein